MDGRTLADQGVLDLDLFPELDIFLLETLLPEGVLDGQEDLLQGKGLLEKIEGPEFGGLDGGFDGPVARDHHNLRIFFARLDLLQDLEAAHFREPNVQEDEVEVLAFQRLQPRFAGCDGLDREPLVFEDALQGGADARFVIDDQDLFVAHSYGLMPGFVW